MPRAAHGRAVALSVRRVLGRRSPREVGHLVVRGVPVEVAHFLSRQGLPEECPGDELVHCEESVVLVVEEMRRDVPRPVLAQGQRPRSTASDAPHDTAPGDGVVRELCDLDGAVRVPSSVAEHRRRIAAPERLLVVRVAQAASVTTTDAPVESAGQVVHQEPRVRCGWCAALWASRAAYALSWVSSWPCVLAGMVSWAWSQSHQYSVLRVFDVTRCPLAAPRRFGPGRPAGSL